MALHETKNTIKINSKYGSFTARQWDSNKRPFGTREFMNDMGQAISAIPGSHILEDFLDHLCKREKQRIFPAWQNDDIFAGLDAHHEPLAISPAPSSNSTISEPAEGGKGKGGRGPPAGSTALPSPLPREPVTRMEIRSTTTSGTERAIRHFGPIPESLQTKHWDEDTRELDRLLHGSLMQLVSGSK